MFFKTRKSMALILVLLSLSVISFIVIDVLNLNSVQLRSVFYMLNEFEAKLISDSLTEFQKLRLNIIKKYKNNPKFSKFLRLINTDLFWKFDIKFFKKLKNINYTSKIIAADGYFPLNKLTNNNSYVKLLYSIWQVYKSNNKLFSLSGVFLDRNVILKIVDFIDKDNKPLVALSESLEVKRGWKVKNDLIEDNSELLAVDGVNEYFYKVIEENCLPIDSSINLNYSTIPLLLALGFNKEVAKFIQKTANVKPFTSLNALLRAVETKFGFTTQSSSSLIKNRELFSTDFRKIRYFLIRNKIKVGDVVYYYELLYDTKQKRTIFKRDFKVF